MTAVAGGNRVIDWLRHRWEPSAERGTASLWPWPVGAGLVGVLAALALSHWRPGQGSWVGRWGWPGDLAAAQVMLQVVAASVMTATSVTFSLVVVALQVASQQFSPRLLRGLAADPALKVVLAVLVATFAYSVTLLRSLSDGDDPPELAMVVTHLAALLALGALLVFINHMARSLRVDTMMVSVHTDAERGIGRFYPAYDERVERPSGPPPPAAVVVTAQRSGFVQLIDVPVLLDLAVEVGWSFWLEVRPGDHVVIGTPLAVVCPAPGASGEVDPERAAGLVDRSLEIGYERTLEQDPSYGFRELADIAVKALSPGINDPITAVHAVGHMADLLVGLSGRGLGPLVHRPEGEGGTEPAAQVQVVTVDGDLRYYLDLACGQIRRYGAQEPTVLIALLRLLRDVAVACRSSEQASEVRRQVELVLAMVPDDLAAEDVAPIEDVARRVELALRGELVPAYRDRSGETRSA